MCEEYKGWRIFTWPGLRIHRSELARITPCKKHENLQNWRVTRILSLPSSMVLEHKMEHVVDTSRENALTPHKTRLQQWWSSTRMVHLHRLSTTHYIHGMPHSSWSSNQAGFGKTHAREGGHPSSPQYCPLHTMSSTFSCSHDHLTAQWPTHYSMECDESWWWTTEASSLPKLPQEKLHLGNCSLRCKDKLTLNRFLQKNRSLRRNDKNTPNSFQ